MIKAPKTDTEHRISFAQSWNLAVTMIPDEWKLELRLKHFHESSRETIINELERWQKYFYQKLVLDFVESEGKDALNKLNTDKPDKLAKHKADFVEDLSD